MNLIANCPVSAETASNLPEDFGKDIATIKRKTICRKYLSVSPYVNIHLELIKKQKQITLAINSIIVNTLYFMTAISINIYYCAAH